MILLFLTYATITKQDIETLNQNFILFLQFGMKSNSLWNKPTKII